MTNLLLTLLAGIFILIGIILGKVLVKNKKFNDLSIGLAFSVMVLLVIMDILPECFESLKLDNTILTIIIILISFIVGFILLKLLDKFVPHHEHEDKHHDHGMEECHEENLEHVGTMLTIPLVIHNVLEGMTIYASSTSNMKTGLLLCLAVGLHNLPLGIMISSTLRSKKELIINTAILTLSTLIGGIILFAIGEIPEFILGVLLSVTIGMITYIVIDELLPNIIENENKKYNILGIIVGILLILISIFIG